MSKTLCPFCGAYSPRQCELEEETGGVCPWEEIEDDEPDDEESMRKLFLEEAQRRNPPMDMERWAKMDPLDVYFEIEAIRARALQPQNQRSMTP